MSSNIHTNHSDSEKTKPVIGGIYDFGNLVWKVLDMQDNRALLITEDIVEKRTYHTEYTDITWKDCELRAYLNGIGKHTGEGFIERFSQLEKEKIVPVTNSNKDNQWYGAKGGEDTKDMIFLLSLEEVVRYFGDSGQLENKPYSFLIDDQYNNNRQAKFINSDSWGWWWLRSPGLGKHDVARVNIHGHVSVSGVYVCGGTVGTNNGVFFNGCYHQKTFAGVRPALWLNALAQEVIRT